MSQQVIDYSEAIDAVATVINKAEREVLISTGHLDSHCYSNPKVLEAIKTAKAKRAKFLVLSGPDLDIESTEATELLKDDIYLLGQRPNVHFTVADSKHLRLENRDPRIDGAYKNITRFNDQLSGNYLRDKFFDALSRARKYSGILSGASH